MKKGTIQYIEEVMEYAIITHSDDYAAWVYQAVLFDPSAQTYYRGLALLNALDWLYEADSRVRGRTIALGRAWKAYRDEFVEPYSGEIKNLVALAKLEQFHLMDIPKFKCAADVLPTVLEIKALRRARETGKHFFRVKHLFANDPRSRETRNNNFTELTTPKLLEVLINLKPEQLFSSTH